MAEVKTSSSALPVFVSVGILALGLTILGTLEFLDRRASSELKATLDAQALELAELKAGLEPSDGTPQATGEGQMLANQEDAQPSKNAAQIDAAKDAEDILRQLKLLSNERGYVIDEIKNLRSRIAKLSARVDQLSDPKQGARAPNTLAPKPEHHHPRPATFAIVWSEEQAHSAPISALRFSPNNQQLATAGLDNTVRLWGISSALGVNTLTGHIKSVTSINYSPDGAWLASSSKDRTIKLWHASSGAQIRTLMGHRGSVDYVVFAEDGSALFSSGADSDLNLWNSKTGTHLRLIADLPQPANAVAYSPRHPVVAVAIGDTIELWNIEKGIQIGALSGHTGMVTVLAFSPDGATLASGSEDNSGRIWSVTKREPIRGLLGHQAVINDLAFSPDGHLLATASKDGQLWLWRVDDGSVVQELPVHSGGVDAVAFSGDGQWLASADARSTLHIWHSGSTDKVALKQ